MKATLATALALALVAGVMGLSAVPFAAAVHEDCHSNFDIADSKQDADIRDLLANGRDVGEEPVSMLGGDEILHVELVDPGNDGELTWKVFEEGQNCSPYNQGDCDQNNELTTETEVTCKLLAPSVGSTTYFVTFEETNGNNAIEFRTWVTPAP